MELIKQCDAHEKMTNLGLNDSMVSKIWILNRNKSTNNSDVNQKQWKGTPHPSVMNYAKFTLQLKSLKESTFEIGYLT